MSWYSPASWWAPVKSLFGRGLATKFDPTYAVSAQFFNPGQPIWSERNYKNFVRGGYRKCGTVYTCVNKISGAAAGIKWKLYTDRSMSREIPEHSLLNLWRKPNPRMGTASLIEQAFGFWHLAGNSYIYANQPNPNEPPVELWPLRPDLMKVVAGEYDIQGYVYGWGTSRAQDFDLDQILHLKFPSYEDPYYGLSPVEVAMQLVDQQNEGNAWNTALMQNAGKPASVFMSKGYLTVEQRTQVRQELLKRYSGKRNAGMPMVLEADMTWQSMSMSPYELDWLQSREFNTREIAAIFDIAPELIGDAAGKTYANVKEAKQSLYTENVLPKLDRVVDDANAWLIPKYPDLDRMGAYLAYDKKDIEVLAELYSAAQQALSEQATEMWNSGQCSLRYAQKLQGMPDRPKVYLDVYKIGSILVREEDLEVYAQQALQKPAAPPSSVPEPMLNQPAPGQQPALPAPKPGTTTVTEVHDDATKQPEKQPTKAPEAGPAKHSDTTPARKVLNLDTQEAKAAYAAHVKQQRADWESKITPHLQNHFDDERKAIVKAIEGCSTEGEATDAVESVLSGQRDALQQQIYNLWHDVGQDTLTETVRQLEEAKASLAGAFSTQQVSYLLNLSSTKVTQINDTTRQQIREALATGVAAGESMPQLAKRIDALYLDDIVPNRSSLIAVSEITAANNWAALEAAKQSPMQLEQVWMTTNVNARPAHADANGQSVPLGENFVVGGEELAFPGDPNGSVGNIARCDCSVYFRRVAQTSKVLTLPPARKKSAYREFMEVYAQ